MIPIGIFLHLHIYCSLGFVPLPPSFKDGELDLRPRLSTPVGENFLSIPDLSWPAVTFFTDTYIMARVCDFVTYCETLKVASVQVPIVVKVIPLIQNVIRF